MESQRFVEHMFILPVENSLFGEAIGNSSSFLWSSVIQITPSRLLIKLTDPEMAMSTIRKCTKPCSKANFGGCHPEGASPDFHTSLGPGFFFARRCECHMRPRVVPANYRRQMIATRSLRVFRILPTGWGTPVM